jgi:aldose 1-epimerase
MEISKDVFWKIVDGWNIDAYTLANKNGMKITCLTYGGIITQLWAPDKNGKFQDIVLGYENMEGILSDTYYMGAIVGRYANRIAKGKFSIEGTTYQLAQNNNDNHLHGGIKGFDKVLFNAEPVNKVPVPSLKLSYISKDGEEGYPGNLNVTIWYSLSETNELSIEYEATSDKQTVFNVTSHMYFNLAADFEKDILQHELMIHAGRFTPTDAGSIPTGALLPVAGTPLDYTTMTLIGAGINDQDQQMVTITILF